ncbi:hypothetical protein OC846_004982 [Tilletia horrida]|uniref:Peptidase A1 domain-containing protein n=1 Tax=Tilletia horrida TaxID=155126 RepID=A0AAN6GNU1_9BASI|nr:hypothetical protein OC846_004982 [Tilletia horrida]KAK0562696.1 hypothetical protein OC861_005185 [Tilletia horrida]
MKIPSSLLSLCSIIPSVCGLTTTKPQAGLGTFDMKLTRTEFSGLVTNITLGTPAQEVTVFVDWTWINLYVIDSVCKGVKDAIYNCVPPSQTFYNESLSTSFKYVDSMGQTTWDPNHFFFNNPATVNYAQEVIGMGATTTNAVIQAADFAFQIPFSFGFLGVFGLSPVFPGDDFKTSASPFWQGWKQGIWKTPYVAYYWCYPDSGKGTSACQGADAIQSLGYYNKSLVDGVVTWYDNIDPSQTEVNSVDFIYEPAVYNYWTLRLSSLKLGGEVQAINKTVVPAVVFDHATYGRGAALSNAAYASLIAKAGATPVELTQKPNNGNQTFYEFDCTKTASLPNITYTFAGNRREWNITAPNYVVPNPNNASSCILDIRVVGEGQAYEIGNFGETFAKDKYIIFDFDRLRVGIADLLW